ncbi:MAG: zinc-ribbon domain-containing protein [Promethearchaeota archaeon]
MPYCPNCGDEITDPSQNFCEKCGSPIPESAKTQEEVSPPIIPSKKTPTPGGGLFDINRNYYILKEKYWDV